MSAEDEDAPAPGMGTATCRRVVDAVLAPTTSLEGGTGDAGTYPDGEGAELPVGGGVEGYEIRGVLGRGAFGQVYRAFAPQLGKEVALKVLTRNSEEFRQRFRMEGRALARLDHPNIARIHDTRTTDDRSFLVMELVEGADIFTYADERKLGVRDRMDLLRQAAEALAHMHRRLLFHRDIKPSNILVTSGEDGRPLVKVIDLGIVKSLDEQQDPDILQTRQGLLLGTPGFMSPEQAGAGGGSPGQSDVYALGAVGYLLLTGNLPIDAEQLLSLIHI